MEEEKTINTAEVAKLTGYKPATVRKYALLLGVPTVGVGTGKAYMWSEADVERFRKAIISPEGRRDKRGKPSSKKNVET